MSTSHLIRLSGLGTLIAAFLLTLTATGFYFADPTGTQSYSVVAQNPLSIASTFAMVVAVFLIALGFIGLYARQAEQIGRGGAALFALTMLMTMGLFAVIWVFAFVTPALAEIAPNFLDEEPGGLLGFTFIIAFMGAPLMWVITALVTLRTGVISRTLVLAYIAGVLINVVGGFFELTEGALMSALLLVTMAVGFGALGYAMWRPAAVAAEPQHPVQPAPIGA